MAGTARQEQRLGFGLRVGGQRMALTPCAYLSGWFCCVEANGEVFFDCKTLFYNSN
jgi:hypothetical protein